MTIRSMPSNDAYRENFDRIFRKRDRAAESVESIQKDAAQKGTDTLSEAEIDGEIDAARKARR